ncbi:unnamed protein product [Alternaria alternata]
MKEEDILARHARPQKYSTWIPKKRDWRYATGVFEHDDIEGTPRDRSAWDDMDYEYQFTDTRKSRECSIGDQSNGYSTGLDQSVSIPGTPEGTKGRHLLGLSKTIVSVEPFKKKAKTAKTSAWHLISRCHQIGKSETEGEQSAYETYSLTVRLRFSGKLIIEDALPHMTTSGSIGFPPLPSTPAKLKTPYSPNSPATARTAKSLLTPYALDSIESAFFRGPPTTNISSAAMNQIQRDSVKNVIIGFKTDTTKGKHDANLHTNHLEPGRYIAEKRSGYILPTFDDLLRGLHHLPSGLDARGLTECLSWYLDFRNSFTPKLDLNVLHTQALIRALRIPLKRFGPQNLDCNELEEWKIWGKFEERKVFYESAKPASAKVDNTEQKRSQLHMNLDDHEVKLDIQLPLRHILVFPFLALHGVVGEALKLGIEKTENRKAERKSAEGRRMSEARWVTQAASDTGSGANNQDMDAEQAQKKVVVPEPAVKAEGKTKQSCFIPERVLTTEALRSLAPALKKPLTAPPADGGPLGHRGPPGPLAAVLSAQASARQPSMPPVSTHLDRPQGVQAPSPAYAPHSAYGRRGYESTRPTDQRDRRGGSGGARYH